MDGCKKGRRKAKGRQGREEAPQKMTNYEQQRQTKTHKMERRKRN